ncbi:ABC-type sugar transport system, ATPase component [Desulfosporosinus orientis DSM 765]|uniref:ABC-type sugar transport system, ATPase component n=1 Tax=Desulfosporosinus orientis (strain ATCC 19365 / DSM 765 / NCIMB 8382 / VKM B-1628 / Singapore I) TaxID=768706 RepID=G7WCG6_DESOD|nr:sugar ABC transporter ATP-binding protein [Desulfosporosinus orientis]AET66288.1 ABC-type sugar transport system, ATPase component [Desulfosporosinus orientis DSM 765]
MADLLTMENINKSFSGIQVLENVQFSLRRGEVHALMGENGAGKSTLMKILSGIYTKDAGSIQIEGTEIIPSSPRAAQDLGVAIIHQELNMIPDLSIQENMFLGREFKLGRTGFINWTKMRAEAKNYLQQLGMDLSPDSLVGELSVGQQQMVEIAKALSMHAKILILDEPTAALTKREIEKLFQLIGTLKKQGVGMIYISHRMEEIFQVSDRITVLRDGRYIGSKETKSMTMDELVQMMVGREIKERFPKVNVTFGKECLRVEDLAQKGVLYDINLIVRAGEILGIAGLMGAGRSELAKALFGVGKYQGKIFVNGKPVTINNPADAIKAGLGLITEDRKGEGLVTELSVRENLALPNLRSLSRFGFISHRLEENFVKDSVSKLRIKVHDHGQEVSSLSGGNQQKVVIGKWLATQPKVLILDEPTRGVDIGAKREIYDLMNQLVEKGVAIIMISSELPEILGMSDRILVMHEGRITGEFSGKDATQETIMLAATGGKSHG